MVHKNKLSIGFFFISITIGIIFTYIISSPNIEAGTEIDTIQKSVADKIIRFHVIANSDSKEDQALKLKVKEAVVDYTSELLKNSSDIAETEMLLNSNMDEIQSIATDVVKKNGYDYPVTTIITDAYFPTKSYGNYTFPPGTYRAFEIRIGNAAGRNWWCVLYPPLCFVDISHGVVDSQSDKMMQETLTTDEYDAITGAGNTKIKFSFRYLNFLNDLW